MQVFLLKKILKSVPTFVLHFQLNQQKLWPSPILFTGIIR